MWVHLADLEFKEGSGVRKNQTAGIKAAEAFRFLVEHGG